MQLPNADHHHHQHHHHHQQGLMHHNFTTTTTATATTSTLVASPTVAADDDPLKSLSLDCLTLFSSGHNTAFSDVVFSVEGKQVHAHRCILAARSFFFRTIFCKGMTAITDASDPHNNIRLDIAPLPIHMPVSIVSYDVLLIVLQFLYSGQLILAFQQGRSKCAERGCCHAHCSSHVDLALDALHAATFFGVEQLSILIQRQLASIIEKISIDDVMRVLVTSRKQGLGTLWTTCSELVARSGLAMETLKKHLPQELATEIEEMRMQRHYIARRNDMLYYNGHSCSSPVSSIDRGTISPMPTARIYKMRQALDSLDVELVRLMVMGEGLDLDGAHALHYSVGSCSRDVVKALLEMGAVNVNHPDQAGRTALHVACDMANPDMISVLLDHHASPLLQTDVGDTPIDVIQGLITASQTGSPTHQNKHNRLRLCLELLQSAAYVADKEDDSSDGAVTEPSSDNTSTRSLYFARKPPCIDIPDCSSSFEPLSACNASIATPISVGQDWGTIESCAFEQEMLTANPESKHHFQQQDHNHHASFLNLSQRGAPTLLGNRGGESMQRDMLSLEKGGFNENVMINDNIRANVVQLPSSSAAFECSITSTASTHENLTACMNSNNMDDYLMYPEFRDFRTQSTPASTPFGNPNSSSIFL